MRVCGYSIAHLYNRQLPSVRLALTRRNLSVQFQFFCYSKVDYTIYNLGKRKRSVPSPKKSKKSSKRARKISSSSEEEQTSDSGDEVQDSSDEDSDRDEASEANSEDEVSNWGLLKVTYMKDFL